MDSASSVNDVQSELLGDARVPPTPGLHELTTVDITSELRGKKAVVLRCVPRRQGLDHASVAEFTPAGFEVPDVSEELVEQRRGGCLQRRRPPWLRLSSSRR